MSAENKPEPIWRRYGGYGLLAILFGPFALLFGGAFLGIDTMRIPSMGVWFMFSLTMCGVIMCVSLLVTGIQNKRMEWIMLLIAAGATYWWGSIFLRQIS